MGMIVETDLPPRLDRLPWLRFHTLVVAALGITWILDGLEVTLAGAVAGALKASPNLQFTDAQVGALYVHEPEGLVRIAGHGLPATAPQRIARGEGLVGQAPVEPRMRHVDEVPADYLTISSATGSNCWASRA